jgi:hypothetical protein
MVTIVFKNLTQNLRVLTDGHGTGGMQGIAIPGRNHGDGCSEPITLTRFKHCEHDIKTALKHKHLELWARVGTEERRMTFEDALDLLTPPPEQLPRAFAAAPAGTSAPAQTRTGGVPAFTPAPPGTKQER